LAVDLTDADLSAVFGKSGSWSRGMIENYKKALESSARVGPGRRPLVPPDMDQELVQFFLARQRDKAPVTICDLINYLEAKSIAVDRSWVHRFLERNEKELAVQKARFIEKARYEVTPEDIKAYFEIVKEHCRSVPSLFVWNVGETRVRSPKRSPPPVVIVSRNTKPGTTLLPEERDDVQLTLFCAISAFGDSTYPMFISRNKTFEKTAVAAQKLYEGRDYTIRTAPRTFITEELFIDWLENVFLPKIQSLRPRFSYDGPAVLLVDGHSTHVTPRVVA
jgi:transposase